MSRHETLTRTIPHRLHEAAEAIDAAGVEGEGSNRAAVFDAEAHIVPGYYPGEKTHLIGVDAPEEWMIHSASVAAQLELTTRGLLFNSIHLGEYRGPRGEEKIAHDVVFHVVDVVWLPEEVTG